MSRKTLERLLERVDGMSALDGDLLKDVADAVRAVFPKAPAHPESIADPTEAVLHLIDRCLPGWTISLTGKATEPDGHWSCYLRESSRRDDDVMIGIGHAPTVTLALVEALLKAAIARA